MSEILLFKPLAEKSAESNLLAFIELCRDRLAVFGADLPFDASVWDVTEHIQARAKTARVSIYFSTWETANDQVPKPMPEPFLSFAKSYVRYQQGFRAVIDQGARLAPLRALWKALQEAAKSSVVEVDGHVLNRAAQIIQETMSPERAYRLGLQLQVLGEFLSEKRLVSVALGWKSHIKRPSDTHRVGKEFDERRQEKLPSAVALDAVAEAYRLARDPSDVIVTSLAAIMCATPDRISEILTLRVDCEHIDRLPDGREVYGLRYWPAKGADPMVKYVIPSMVDLVKDALARIRRHTESARSLARWYEENPRRLFLPAHLEVLRNSDLTIEHVAEILSGEADDTKAAVGWLQSRKIWPPGIRRKAFRLPFAALENEVIESLPNRFPYIDVGLELKYSEALCTVHPYMFNTQKRTAKYRLHSVSHQNIGQSLGDIIDVGGSSVFSRLGISGPDGEPIRINTHQFRHYLNTLAMHGGLSDLDIAKWSGRKDVRQNRAYDHVSARDKLALIREAVGDQSKMFGPLEHVPNVPAIQRDEFANLKVMNAHTTEFGYCIHDYASTPCQKYLDCLNCNELVCVKGDGVREANVRRQLEETRGLLAAAVKSNEDGAYGADRWVEHQTQTLQRLEELCAILENPSVQQGAVIQLKHLPTVSRLVQAGEVLGIDLTSKSGSETGLAEFVGVDKKDSIPEVGV